MTKNVALIPAVVLAAALLLTRSSTVRRSHAIPRRSRNIRCTAMKASASNDKFDAVAQP